MQEPEEICLKGHQISRGIAIGRAFILDLSETPIPEFLLSSEQIENEIIRYRRALEESYLGLLQLKKQLEQEGVNDGVQVLESHLQIIQDPLFTGKVEKDIRELRKNAEFVFQLAIQAFHEKFQSFQDPFFQERFEDVQDISKRVLDALRECKRSGLADVPQNSIVFAQNLSPTNAASAKPGIVAGFVTQMGGGMSHTAIVAKAKGIPYVSNVDFSKLGRMQDNSLTIVDGLSGKIIINPTQKTLGEYTNFTRYIRVEHDNLERTSHLPAVTTDGEQIRLSANVEISDDFVLLKQFGAEGVGLFRSEYLVLQRGGFPSEEEQFVIYKNLVKSLSNHPIVIRAFDIGLDKVVCSLKGNLEPNPALGCRAIRYLLREKDLFKTQMRAVLRASFYGDVRILFPMISNLNELLEAKEIVFDAADELIKEGFLCRKDIKIGCMIEVPSAAMIADHLAKEVDFFSIGTNDLTQYALAIDRTYQETSALHTSTHPGVIRLMRVIVQEAEAQNVPVCVCGEIASDPRFVPLLLGLHIKELSASCRFLPLIKQVIRNTSKARSEELAEYILTLKTSHEIQNVLIEEYQNNLALRTVNQL